MSLRKALFLTKTVCYKTSQLQTTNYARQKERLFTTTCSRLYTAENKDGKKPPPSGAAASAAPTAPGSAEKVDILGRLFTQGGGAARSEEERIRQEQEQFDKQNKEKSEENEKSWRRMKIGFAVFGGAMTVMGGCLVVEMGAPRRDDNGEIIRDEYSDQPTAMQYLKRTWKELTFYEKMIKEPSREKLLPDPLPAPYQPTYTLVLEFTDVLVHPDWSYQTGWRFKKRPGVDQFLQTVASADYEVIIFTTENAFMIYPVIDKLDPENKLVSYRLFRDSTHFIDGQHVKNLDGLNRDLSKVIVVDWNKQAIKFHPQNSLILKKWKGADDDTSLLDLANLLQTIAMSNITDVREVLNYYSQFDDPIAAFRDNQRRLMEQMERTPPAPASSWLRTFTTRVDKDKIKP